MLAKHENMTRAVAYEEDDEEGSTVVAYAEGGSITVAYEEGGKLSVAVRFGRNQESERCGSCFCT